jgi:hypothetical protein
VEIQKLSPTKISYSDKATKFSVGSNIYLFSLRHVEISFYWLIQRLSRVIQSPNFTTRVNKSADTRNRIMQVTSRVIGVRRGVGLVAGKIILYSNNLGGI